MSIEAPVAPTTGSLGAGTLGAGSVGVGSVGTGSVGAGSVAVAGMLGAETEMTVIAIALGMMARAMRPRWSNGAPFYQRVTHAADGGGGTAPSALGSGTRRSDIRSSDGSGDGARRRACQ